MVVQAGSWYFVQLLCLFVCQLLLSTPRTRASLHISSCRPSWLASEAPFFAFGQTTFISTATCPSNSKVCPNHGCRTWRLLQVLSPVSPCLNLKNVLPLCLHLLFSPRSPTRPLPSKQAWRAWPRLFLLLSTAAICLLNFSLSMEAMPTTSLLQSWCNFPGRPNFSW